MTVTVATGTYNDVKHLHYQFRFFSINGFFSKEFFFGVF